jgi:omega-6 fatty acid desaturase (delta-12 desaturase)
MSDSILPNGAEQANTPTWKEIVARYQKPSIGRATWQMINTFIPFLALWVLMYLTRGISWWLTVPMAILAGALTVRMFIIFHDCGHGSFFKSKRASSILGFICGMISFTPYSHWRWQHSIHHATSGDLDRRGDGRCARWSVDMVLSEGRHARWRMGR